MRASTEANGAFTNLEKGFQASIARLIRSGGLMGTVLGFLAAPAALALAFPASAATTLMLNTGGTTVGAGKNFTSGSGANSVTVHVTAWSTTSGTNFGFSSGHSAATLGQWAEGLGVLNGSSDEHTIDNNGTKKDYILLEFSTAVALKSATFITGWWDMYDTDATISYANVNYANAGITYNSTGSAFWNAAGTALHNNAYSSASVGKSYNSTRSIAPNSPTLVTSTVWLIAAKIGDIDTYKDSFKVKAITYDLPPAEPGGDAVPEPSIWAMLILGMGVVGSSMRRRAATRLTLA